MRFCVMASNLNLGTHICDFNSRPVGDFDFFRFFEFGQFFPNCHVRRATLPNKEEKKQEVLKRRVPPRQGACATFHKNNPTVEFFYLSTPWSVSHLVAYNALPIHLDHFEE